jgi:hypothetical protein
MNVGVVITVAMPMLLREFWPYGIILMIMCVCLLFKLSRHSCREIC